MSIAGVIWWLVAMAMAISTTAAMPAAPGRRALAIRSTRVIEARYRRYAYAWGEKYSWPTQLPSRNTQVVSQMIRRSVVRDAARVKTAAAVASASTKGAHRAMAMALSAPTHSCSRWLPAKKPGQLWYTGRTSMLGSTPPVRSMKSTIPMCFHAQEYRTAS